jgi:hypothetical protein
MKKLVQLKLDFNESVSSGDKNQILVISKRLDKLIDDFIKKSIHIELKKN